MQGELNVDAGFWGGIVPDNAGHHSTLQAMVDAGVLGFKSFMIPSGVATSQLTITVPLLRPLERSGYVVQKRMVAETGSVCSNGPKTCLGRMDHRRNFWLSQASMTSPMFMRRTSERRCHF